jgi:hypothetical protein
MFYAKIDSSGQVTKFPYRLTRDEENNIPADVVEVDTRTNRIPDLKWYEGMWYDQVIKVGGTYQVTYTKGLKKYSTDQDKKQTLSILVRDALLKNTSELQNGNITEETYQSNIAILNSIDIDDETTYDLYNTTSL